MVQRRAELRLALEAAADLLGAVGVQPLDRDVALEAAVLGEEDGGHPASADPALHAVPISYQLACHPDGHGICVPPEGAGANERGAAGAAPTQELDALDQRARAEPAAAAHRHEAHFLVRALELVKQRRDQA